MRLGYCAAVMCVVVMLRCYVGVMLLFCRAAAMCPVNVVACCCCAVVLLCCCVDVFLYCGGGVL